MFRLVGARLVKSSSASCPSNPIRSFHLSLARSSGKKSTTSRDTRIAGRLRFYKQVGVEEVEAPWDSAAKKKDPNNEEDVNCVASPISAGVDGTDSASGVHRPSSLSDTSSSFKHMLSPRPPGASTEFQDDDDSSSSTRWFGVTLDGRGVSTPMGNKLAVPSEKLAHMIAAEWDAQDKHLRPVNMPLMTLACTALDQVAHHPNVYREQSLRFLPTDTVSAELENWNYSCFFSSMIHPSCPY